MSAFGLADTVFMTISEEVILKRGSVKECLQDAVHEAGIAKVVETS